jgi:bifunctional non-homologous end joining protein LigD
VKRAAKHRGMSGARARPVETPVVTQVAGIRLTHPDRVLYPEQGLTKRDLARFY